VHELIGTETPYEIVHEINAGGTGNSAAIAVHLVKG
jgi:hypothetical protein